MAYQVNKDVKYLNWTLFFGYFTAMQPWFFYGTWVKNPVYALFTVFLLLPCFCKPYLFDKKSVNRNQLRMCLLFLSLLFLHFTMGVNATLGVLPSIVILVFLFYLRSDLKVEALRFITEKMAICVGISLAVHIVFLIVNIPSGTFFPPDGSYNKGFDMQYVNIVSSWMPYKRFQSVFIEPGHLIVGIFPLLLINKFNLKNKYVLILFIALLFSLSLSGYLYSIVAFIYLSLSRGNVKKCIISIAASLCFIAGMYFYMQANEDSVLTKAIAERLVFEDGDFTGDNRVTDFVDNIYNKVKESDDIYFGTHIYDKAMIGEGINGYKAIAIRSGIVPLLLIAFAFFVQYKNCRSKDSLFLVLMLILMNSQNFYPYWVCTLIILIGGPYYLKINKNE